MCFCGSGPTGPDRRDRAVSSRARALRSQYNRQPQSGENRTPDVHLSDIYFDAAHTAYTRDGETPFIGYIGDIGSEPETSKRRPIARRLLLARAKSSLPRSDHRPMRMLPITSPPRSLVPLARRLAASVALPALAVRDELELAQVWPAQAAARATVSLQRWRAAAWRVVPRAWLALQCRARRPRRGRPMDVRASNWRWSVFECRACSGTTCNHRARAARSRHRHRTIVSPRAAPACAEAAADRHRLQEES